MEGRTWEIPIYEGEQWRGRLQVWRQGLRTVFSARCPGAADGIRKLWLHGARGGLLLGTLLPEGEELVLRRTVSNALLREKGAEECPRAELELLRREQLPAKQEPEEAGGWLPVDRLELPDLALARALRSLHQGVWRREGRWFRVCCPWRVGERMPCMPIFCFASWSSRKGGVLSWFFDERGKPCIKPDGAGENRGTT